MANVVPSVIIDDVRLAPVGRAAEPTEVVRQRWPRATRAPEPGGEPMQLARLTVLAVAALAAAMTLYIVY